MKAIGFQQWWRENVANAFLSPKPAARRAWIHQQQRIDELEELYADEKKSSDALLDSVFQYGTENTKLQLRITELEDKS